MSASSSGARRTPRPGRERFSRRCSTPPCSICHSVQPWPATRCLSQTWPNSPASSSVAARKSSASSPLVRPHRRCPVSLRRPSRPGAEPGLGRPPAAPLRRAHPGRRPSLERARPHSRHAHRRRDDHQHAAHLFIPSLAIYQITLEIWAGQQRVTAERQRLNHAGTVELRNAPPGMISDSDWRRLRVVARDIQNGILRTRLDVSRVPEWFYRHYRNRDELDFADTAEGHRRRLVLQRHFVIMGLVRRAA